MVVLQSRQDRYPRWGLGCVTAATKCFRITKVCGDEEEDSVIPFKLPSGLGLYAPKPCTSVAALVDWVVQDSRNGYLSWGGWQGSTSPRQRMYRRDIRSSDVESPSRTNERWEMYDPWAMRVEGGLQSLCLEFISMLLPEEPERLFFSPATPNLWSRLFQGGWPAIRPEFRFFNVALETKHWNVAATRRRKT